MARYLALYFDSDDAIAADPAFASWLDELDATVPTGVAELAGSPVTVDGAVMLLSTLIYMATVEHEIVDSGVWDYQLWSDVQPVRVYASGVRQPLDVYQRIVNANFILNVNRTSLMSDFSSLALDRRGSGRVPPFPPRAGRPPGGDGRTESCLLANRTTEPESQHQLLTPRIDSEDVFRGRALWRMAECKKVG